MTATTEPEPYQAGATTRQIHQIHHDDPRLMRLRAILQDMQNRLRWQEAVSLLPASVALGLAATTLLALMWRINPWAPIPIQILLAVGAGLLVPGAAITSTLYALLRPRSLAATARRADRLLSLDERLSTALEDAVRLPANAGASAGPTPQQIALMHAQLDDALAHAASISPHRDIPVRVRGQKLAPVGAMLALLMAVLVVPDQVLAPLTGVVDQVARQQIAQEQRKIEALKQALEAQPRAHTDPALKELLEELSRLSTDLSNQRLSREQAMARLSEAESSLQKILDPQSTARREALDQMAQQLAASESQTAREMAQALHRGDYEQAGDILKQAGQDPSAMTPQERRALAEALKQARDSAVALDPELARRLNEAAQPLQTGDAHAVKQALEDAGRYVQDAGRNVATQEQVARALAQIQQSKANIAGAGQGTQVALATAVAAGTILTGTPVVISGTIPAGTPVAVGSPVTGQLAPTGTPVLPSNGTPALVQGQGQGGSTGSGGSGVGSSSWGTGHTEPVYAPPTTLDASLTPVVVQGRDNPGGEQSSAATNSGPNVTGRAQVPYEQVYGEYSERAGRALDSEYIPQGYKDLVRDYFTDIKP